jgi:tetratricopeptide (TPR) repeat protein
VLALALAMAAALVASPPVVWAGSTAKIKVEEAKEKFSAEDYRGALGLCEEALAEEPDNVEALHYAGLCQMGLKNPAAAVKYLRSAAEKKPGDAGLQEDLAWAAIESQDFTVALSAAERALALSPSSDRARLLKGQALLGLKRCEEALSVLDNIPGSSPYSQAALFYRGLCLASQGKSAEAADAFDQAAAKDPGTELGRQAAEYSAVLKGGAPAEEGARPWGLKLRVLYQFDCNMARAKDPGRMPGQKSNR